MVENIMRVISDNRFWIMPVLLMIEVPVAVWMVGKMFKDGVEKFNREKRERHEKVQIQSSKFKIEIGG